MQSRTNRTFSAFIAASAITAATNAQTWTKQSPWPANDHLEGVFFVSETTGWIAGADNILMKTTDGGATWTQTRSLPRDPSGIGYGLHHVQFASPTHGFALGDRGYRTVDGGATWQETAPLLPGTVLDIDFVSTQRGFAWNRRSMMKTTNAGSSWAFTVPENLSGNFMYDADFFSEDLALMVGQLNSQWGVFRSTTAGANWQRISTQTLKHVAYMTQDIVIGASTTGFYRSIDGGATWQLTYDDFDFHSQADVEHITRIDDNRAAAIGFDGRIWMTTNQGQTWTRVRGTIGSWGVGWEIHFPSPNVGYAAGRAGLIYKTSDGGQTWTQISRGASYPMNDIVMKPTGFGIAVGQDGMVLRTTDFGQMWTAKQLKPQGLFPHIGDLNTIDVVDSDTMFVGGQYGRIYRSDDAGLTWLQMAEFGGNADVLDLDFINENIGFACGILNAPLGFIDSTIDGGQNWTRRFLGEPYPHAIHMFDALNGRAMVGNSTNMRTTDGFVTHPWTTLPGDPPRYYMAYADDGSMTGWYSGPHANLLKTTDGGLSFTEQALPGFVNNGGALSDWLTDIRPLSPTKAYASTYQFGNPSVATIYVTNDGNTWQTLQPLQDSSRMSATVIGAIDMLPTGEIWAAGGDGTIYNSGFPQLATPGDANGDGAVNVSDLLIVIGAWGTCQPAPATCPADFNDDDVVNVTDLLTVISNWG